MCAKPAPNVTWRREVSGLQLEVQVPIPEIALDKTVFRRCQFRHVPLDYNLYNAGFDAAWELDIFGGTRRLLKPPVPKWALRFSASAMCWSRCWRKSRGITLRRAATSNASPSRFKISRFQQDILNLTSNRFENGLSSDLDVQQALALLTATEAEVPSLKTGFDQSVHHLAVLLGQPPGALMDEMSVEKPIPLTPPTVPVGLPSDLLQRRPDVQKSERELAAATARIGVAKADLFPKFSLTGFAGLESVSTGNFFNYASRAWSAGPTVQWELFEAGSIRANVRVQNARQEQALDAYEQTVLVALEDAENALTAYAREQTRRESLSQSVQANRQALELSTATLQQAAWRISARAGFRAFALRGTGCAGAKRSNGFAQPGAAYTKRLAAAGKSSAERNNFRNHA
jgi:multidrug efflux system outer membrane protein